MRLEYQVADDVCCAVRILSGLEEFSHLDPSRIGCLRSRGSKSRAYARIYGLPRPFSEAFSLRPLYVIEVVSENFDDLALEAKIRVVVHELLHIPYTFSGGLRPHGRLVNGRRVNAIVKRVLRDDRLFNFLARCMDEA